MTATITTSPISYAINAWRREHEEPGQTGLEIQISFLHAGMNGEFVTSGHIQFDDDYEPWVETVIQNQLSLDDRICHELLLAGCAIIWNSIVAGDGVAAHTRWREATTWLHEHFTPEHANRLQRTIERSVVVHQH